ncbi:hypothetical protein LBMAG27_08050 [Bacteroidota bacterium]|nr:hypothetical protein LBMAG27_08050 [Bacteroidota bacterium]
MNISPSLAKKIAAYSTLATAFLAGREEANAQIIYTDVFPDATFIPTGSSYGLDLNNDGQNDFKIKLINYSGSSSSSGSSSVKAVGAAGPAGNSVMGNSFSVSGSNIYLANALAMGDTIGANQQWKACSNSSFSSSSSSSSFNASMIMAASVPYYSIVLGNWLGVQDKYLGLKFKIGASNYYGWARLNVDTVNWSFTIKDYAFNAEPDSQILAGQLFPTSASEIITADKDLYKIKTVNNLLYLSLNSNEFIGAKLTIYNMSGAEIRTQELLDIETPLKLRDIGKGVYLVKVVRGEKQQVKKVVVNY